MLRVNEISKREEDEEEEKGPVTGEKIGENRVCAFEMEGSYFAK